MHFVGVNGFSFRMFDESKLGEFNVCETTFCFFRELNAVGLRSLPCLPQVCVSSNTVHHDIVEFHQSCQTICQGHSSLCIAVFFLKLFSFPFHEKRWNNLPWNQLWFKKIGMKGFQFAENIEFPGICLLTSCP